jgi:Phytanoyl-CoA dioxygenase (PhyH)
MLKDGASLNDAEKLAYERWGYLVRERSFSESECAAIALECEALLADLAHRKPAAAVLSGTHPVNLFGDLDVTVKWEREHPDKIRGIEPFAHLNERLEAWAYDPRLTEPSKFICDADEVTLFTEKLHTKRARTGGEIELHQDFPYWEPFGPRAARIMTAMLLLDDATAANGCLEVAPGTHGGNVHEMRSELKGIDSKRMDPAKFEAGRLTPIEAPAGSVLFFNAFLVHRSGHNRSDQDRRSILFSYQPAGLPHARLFKRGQRG